MTVESPIDIQDPWHDDVLERRALGKVLEDHLINRFAAGNHEPLSLALDGRWGSGKSFFVDRWTKQLIQNGRFVISFNAWQHDGAPEPSLALIGELRRQLQYLSKQVISQKATSEAIEAQMQSTISSAKKAIKPMLKVAASGLLKRAIGSSLSDFAAAMPEEDEEPTPNSDTKILDKALDAYLDQMLSDHELHQASISKFRDDLAALASALSEVKAPDEQPIGPVIIIIDELDRCRPNFAVQLLEGIKHLFSVDNVCFVFATNLPQLTASIQVVYGANFSGREYLGRFFDRELTLPNLSGSGFSKLLCKQPLSENLIMGEYRVKYLNLENQKAEYWLALSSALHLTLRQQQQAFAILQTSCEAYSKETKLPGVWLMFLSQLKAASPDKFNDLHKKRHGTLSTRDFQTNIATTTWIDRKISIPQPRSPLHKEDQSLLSLIIKFFDYSKLNQNTARDSLRNAKDAFTEEIQDYICTFKDKNSTTVLGSTFDVVSAAGMFTY